ncbi:hypothetical protein [Roseicella frigidaeris]|uniref:Uncharacterized protein n=1 Tax=Roseicella frigidaeris TaxID=2230885 RepID=A0A327M9D0_9PROT|nr:hypothetical protein [Roseicella frigidaeris]RAI59931.1 hypothetical protein DOO78_06720 [Roseicella frigidaeris]
MPQDDDFARLAAALGVPGLLYRSFGNAPVRPGEAASPAPPALGWAMGPGRAGRPEAGAGWRPRPVAAPEAWPLLAPLFAPAAAGEAPAGTLARLRAAPGAAERRPAATPFLPDPLFAPRPARGAGLR